MKELILVTRYEKGESFSKLCGREKGRKETDDFSTGVAFDWRSLYLVSRYLMIMIGDERQEKTNPCC